MGDTHKGQQLLNRAEELENSDGIGMARFDIALYCHFFVCLQSQLLISFMSYIFECSMCCIGNRVANNVAADDQTSMFDDRAGVFQISGQRGV